MKKLFLCLAGAAAALTLNAKVWRVNYDENAKADFKTIAAACATTLVSDGDTLYMEPGLHGGAEEDNTISRSLTIFGPGWGFKANDGAMASIANAYLYKTVMINADNVTIMGIVTQGSIRIKKAYHNIHIERCRANNIDIYSAAYVSYRGWRSGIIVRNNYALGNISLTDAQLLDNLIVENNIVKGSVYVTNGESDTNGFHSIVRHNIVYGTITQQYGVDAHDNILFGSKPITFNTIYDNYRFYNNVLAISQEQYDADQTSVSPVGYSNYADNIFAGATFANTCKDSIGGIYFDDAMRYQVRSDSPAKNAATDGTDCGAFGGEHPFVLYGRPEGIPYIYDVEVPAYPTDNKLNISFKVAGQNE